MSDQLTFVAASAGTGKTFRLVREVLEAVKSGIARPSGVIATTFTRAAAGEMAARLAQAFHEDGLHDEALALEDGLLSTVHGICFELLNRFAFEAGLSPDVRILPEAEANLLLDRALEEVADEARRQELYTLASRLGERNPRKGTWNWRGDVRAIVETARTNDLAFDEVRSMGRKSMEEIEEALGPATSDNLDELLREAIDSFLILSASSTTKVTSNYCELLNPFLGESRPDWPQWAGLHGASGPEKKLQAEAEAIANVAGRATEHPALRADLARYLDLLFELAAEVGDRFTLLKRERGAADFTDLEKEALDLLRQHASVREVLAEEIDLLLVDEFQDTSPIQLALFTELGKLAGRVIWVGDVKQSIYGFRHADPELVFAAARKAGTADTLEKSWRSVPDLVTLSNRLFAAPFHERLGLPASQTEIAAQRAVPPSLPPAIEVATISSGESYKNGNPKPLWQRKWQVVADAVEDLLSRSASPITPKSSLAAEQPEGVPRAVTPGDIAILVRTGRAAQALATTLRNRGLDVALTAPGLLATPEVRLALACLRRWLDPADSLAAAEVIALEARHSSRQWLEHRLADQHDREEHEAVTPWVLSSSPALVALHEGADQRAERLLASLLTAFEEALALSGAARIVECWGPSPTRSEQRLANLEELRKLIAEHESQCVRAGVPATFNGLFAWLDDLAETEQDHLASYAGDGAIHVGTYHGAKGLEWPVVFLADLDHETRSSLFRLRVVEAAGGDFDLEEPLAGRELRQWVSPFAHQQSHPLLDRLAASPTGREVHKHDEDEALRLLYVGITRARDHLVLLHEPAKDNALPTWLASLGLEKVGELLGTEDAVHLGQSPPLRVTRSRFEWRGDPTPPPPPPTASLPRVTDQRTPRPPAILTPSSEHAVDGARTGSPLEYGPRLDWARNLQPGPLGSAVHRILAAEVLHPDHPDQLARIAALLRAFDLPDVLSPDQLSGAVHRYLSFVDEHFRPLRHRVEVPFSILRPDGQRLTGIIDHLLDTEDGPVVIDHKIFPGSRDALETKALSYSGQLQLYREALGSDARPRTFIHFLTSGLLLPVEF